MRLGWPGLNVPSEAHDVAGFLNRSLTSRSVVVAPPEINVWIPTFHQHAYPLVVRKYLSTWRFVLSREDVQLRRQMIQAAARANFSRPDSRQEFLDGLEQFDVKGICLRRRRKSIEGRLDFLRPAGFRRMMSSARYEIWILHEPDPRHEG